MVVRRRKRPTHRTRSALPRELPKRCIKLFSFRGDTVLDPFVGSGATMIEAMANERRAVGLEKESNYCFLALKRLKEECGLQSSQFCLENRGGGVKYTYPSWRW